MQNQQRIPFTVGVPDSFEYTSSEMVERQGGGLVGLEDDHLVIQVQVTTTATSMMTMSVDTDVSDVDEHRIPLRAIASVHISGRWGRKMKIMANDLRLFNEVPGSQSGMLVLRFKRAHREAADDLATRLQFALSDLGLARLDRRIEALESNRGLEASDVGQLESGSATSENSHLAEE